MIRISETESAKSIAELKTSNVTKGRSRTNFEVLDFFKKASDLKTSSTAKEGSSFKKQMHRKKKRSHGKASCMDDL